jgi:hypothetical protein
MSRWFGVVGGRVLSYWASSDGYIHLLLILRRTFSLGRNSSLLRLCCLRVEFFQSQSGAYNSLVTIFLDFKAVGVLVVSELFIVSLIQIIKHKLMNGFILQVLVKSESKFSVRLEISN